MNDSQQPRRAPRIDLHAPASLTVDGSNHVEITLLDLSSGGFRLRSEELLQQGERVTIHTGAEDGMPAEIRWVRGFEAGGVFLEAPRDVD